VATNFRTGTSTEQTFSVSANQFNTSSWDDDGDGVSNLDELIAGDNPEGNDVPESTQATLELVPDKTFRLTWSSSPSADYYRVLENPDGVSGFTAVSGNLAGTILSYDHRVALFKRTNAQYRVQACNNVGCADSEILSVTGTLEQGIGYFKAPNAQGGVVDSSHGSPISFGADHFGASVKLSADGNTLVMGAANEDSGATGVNGSQDDDSVIDSGAVYVFARIDNQWKLDAYIKASNTDENDNFGAKLSLSDDGNTLAVGVYNESSSAIGVGGDQIDNSAYQSGAVYVFARSNGAWVQQSYIKASNAEARDQFGLSVC